MWDSTKKYIEAMYDDDMQQYYFDVKLKVFY